MADVKPNATGAPASDQPAEKAGWKALARRLLKHSVWPIGLIGWGAAAWLLFTAPDAPTPTSETAPTAVLVPPTYYVDEETLEELGPTGEQSVAEVIQRVDQALAERNPKGAIDLLEKLDETRDESLRADVVYRRGVAYEAVGDMASSEPNYRALLDGTHPEHFVRAAKLGLARIWWHENRPELTIALLSEMLVTQGEAGLGTDVYGEVLHTLAQARYAKIFPREAADWLNDDYCCYLWPQLSTGYMIEIIHRAAAPETETLPDEISVVFQRGKTADGVLLRVHQPTRSIHDLIRDLTAPAKLSVEWSNEAASIATRHMSTIHAPASSLAVLLDNLLEPLDLGWELQGDRLSIKMTSQLLEASAADLRVAAATRSLQDATALAPEHPFVAFAYLALGNISYRAGDYSDAFVKYDTLVQQYRRAGCIAEAWLNLGKAQMRFAKRQDALRSFFHVADTAVGTPLEAIGYIYAGRVLLEDRQFKEAIQPLRRAVPRAATVDVRVAATVCLAMAYIDNDEPRNANLVLMDNNKYIERSRFKNAAALVDAAARYDAATDPDVQVNQGRSVVSALARVAPEDFFGLHAYLFVGEACDRMGLADQMARIYTSAIERQLPPELERRIRIQLSNYWTSIGDSSNALKILASLRDSDNRELAVEARLKMATLHLAREEYDQSKDLCMWLIANTSDEPTRREALRTLGRAYEALKQFDKAANCFEGLVPADDAQLLKQKEKEPATGVSTS